MNERIKQLWTQAGGNYNSGDQHQWPQYTIDDPEKFAELIVRECAESLWSEACHVSDLAYEEFEKNSKKIRKHFGIE